MGERPIRFNGAVVRSIHCQRPHSLATATRDSSFARLGNGPIGDLASSRIPCVPVLSLSQSNQAQLRRELGSLFIDAIGLYVKPLAKLCAQAQNVRYHVDIPIDIPFHRESITGDRLMKKHEPPLRDIKLCNALSQCIISFRRKKLAVLNKGRQRARINYRNRLGNLLVLPSISDLLLALGNPYRGTNLQGLKRQNIDSDLRMHCRLLLALSPRQPNWEYTDEKCDECSQESCHRRNSCPVHTGRSRTPCLYHQIASRLPNLHHNTHGLHPRERFHILPRPSCRRRAGEVTSG